MAAKLRLLVMLLRLVSSTAARAAADSFSG
jgi:hypothetical protein